MGYAGELERCGDPLLWSLAAELASGSGSGFGAGKPCTEWNEHCDCKYFDNFQLRTCKGLVRQPGRDGMVTRFTETLRLPRIASLRSKINGLWIV